MGKVLHVLEELQIQAPGLGAGMLVIRLGNVGSRDRVLSKGRRVGAKVCWAQPEQLGFSVLAGLEHVGTAEPQGSPWQLGRLGPVWWPWSKSLALGTELQVTPQPTGEAALQSPNNTKPCLAFGSVGPGLLWLWRDTQGPESLGLCRRCRFQTCWEGSPEGSEPCSSSESTGWPWLWPWLWDPAAEPGWGTGGICSWSQSPDARLAEERFIVHHSQAFGACKHKWFSEMKSPSPPVCYPQIGVCYPQIGICYTVAPQQPSLVI